MDKYAVIKIGPFQYTVRENETYTIPNFEAEVGKKLEITEVLAVNNGKEFLVGTPNVKNVKVNVEILGQEKGEKVTTFIYRAKSRYRKKSGFRKHVTKFKVLTIA